MDKVKILIEARALIDTPEKWIKDSFAGDGIGACNELHENACQFCMLGAVSRSRANNDLYHSDGEQEIFDILVKAIDDDEITNDFGWYRGIHRFNDHDETEHRDIMNVFDKAIEIAKGIE